MSQMDIMDANFCFESCRGRGRGVDALVCKGSEMMWHGACGKGWDGTCPKCRTDEKVEVFVMPKVPKGQVLIKVEGVGGGGGAVEKAIGGGTWRTCGVGWCAYTMKYGSHLKQHKAAIHNIDLVWHDCPELRCEYKAKVKGHIKQHRTNVHDIGVTWHDCPEPNSSYKAKQEAHLRLHRATVHGIGVSWHACTELG